MSASSWLELACRSAACAPPPVGTGGSEGGPGTSRGRAVWARELSNYGILDSAYRQGPVSNREVVAKALASSDPKEMVEDRDFGWQEPVPVSLVIEMLQEAHRDVLASFPAHGNRLRLIRSTPAEEAKDPFQVREDRYSYDQLISAPTVTSWSSREYDIINKSTNWGGEATVKSISKHQIIAPGGIISDEFLVAKDRRLVDALMAYPAKKLKGVDVMPIATYPERADLAAGLFPSVPLSVQGWIELACHSAACAPPPVGSGGSLYGGGYEALFGEGRSPVVAAPWPRAGRSKKLKDYDANAVGRAIREGKLRKIDPRTLRATQPSVTAPGVKHYMDGDAGLYADADRPTNKHPLVYVRHNPDGSTENLLLSGHHRATSALLKGEDLEAIIAEGGWGEPR